MKALPLSYSDHFQPGNLEGFSPQISLLVHSLEYVRTNTLHAVNGLSTAELDTQVLPGGNTIGMLLAHFAGTEHGYGRLTFDGRTDGFDHPENVLGEAGRAAFQGQELDFYLARMAQVRAQTLAELSQRDDDWLSAGLPPELDLFGVPTNHHWCWFHVMEDELRHQGQITILRKELERRAADA